MGKKKQTVYLLSHFHWDREWYQPFEQYRFRLVRAIDDLLDIMDRDPDYRHFHFDGHTILIKDYLKIRPQNAQRLKDRITEGRILIGPWYVMPDEFLVSGESLVRNLQMGGAICREYGVEPLKNYYVTDIFGHNSQSPQIAKGFGLPSATLYRGIGDYPKDMFCWQGADGSTVDVYKLDPNYTYSTFYFAARQPFDGRDFDRGEILERMRTYLDYAKSLAVSDIMISMDGCDHADPEPMTPSFIKMINEELDDFEIIHTTMNRFNEDVKNRSLRLETLEGVLYNSGREGITNMLLQNVLSSCVVLKQQNAHCEMLLTRVVEPLDVFTEMLLGDEAVPPRDYTASPRTDYLKEAWDLLIQNHPHDSICGCSVGEVHMDNENRFMHVRQISHELQKDASRRLLSFTDTSGKGKDGAFAVYNLGPAAIDGMTVFELKIPGGKDSSLHLYDPEGNELEFQVLDCSADMTAEHAKLALVRFELWNVLKIAARLSIPAHSYAVYTLEYHVARTGDPVYNGTPIIPNKRLAGSMQTAPLRFDNGPLQIAVCGDGTLSVTVRETGKRYEGLLKLEDGGDAGDGWRYIPPQFDQKIYSGGNTSVSVLSDGPFCAQVGIRHSLSIPVSADATRRSREVTELVTESVVTLLKDSPVLAVRTSLSNRAAAHRLRTLIPSGLRTDTYYSKLPYDMYCWDVRRPDNSKHVDVDSKVTPAQGAAFLTDGKDRIALYTRGLYEIEMAEDGGRTLFLTLFRSVTSEVGRLKPLFADMKRDLEFDYALDFSLDNTPAGAYIRAEQFLCPPFTQLTDCHGGKLAPVQTPVRLTGPSHALITAVQPGFALEDGRTGTAIRVLNIGEEAWNGRVVLNTAGNVRFTHALLCELDGRIIDNAVPVNGAVPLSLRRKQVGTVVALFEK